MTTVQAATVAERRAQADLYASLTPQEWAAPSLCAGWRVHHVLAHTTMPFRWSRPRMLLGMVRARGSFDRFADRATRADAAALSPATLVDRLRENEAFEWTPPGGGPLSALSHDVIHGLDVAVALGREEHVSAERAAMVLAGMEPRHLRSFGTSLDGVALRASDEDLALGEGAVVRGRAADLLLAVCGRAVPAGRLEGDGVPRLTGAR